MGTNIFRIEFEDGITKSATLDIESPKDVIMFVAGTTDPVNTKGKNHEANKDYWRPEKKDLNNLWKSVKALKPQYLDLHIEDNFFSWSGDNNHDERVKGAERLLDLFLRVYSGWKDKKVYLHLIGHSHGGNVINEFTNVIAKGSKFPKQWKVKSITYLSTPFFRKQHQLNHSKLHKSCKIINVYNQYDITQRFVADFTLENLEILLANFKIEEFEKVTKRLNNFDFSIYNELGIWNVVDNETEGPLMWSQTEIILSCIRDVLEIIIKNVSYFKASGPLFTEKETLLARLRALHTWAETQRGVFERNSRNRDGGYGRSEFLEDINLLEVLRMINVITAINTGVQDSYLLTVLNNIIQNKASGVIQMIDDTTWTPKEQVQGAFSIIDISITDKDPYDKRNLKSAYEGFITGIEDQVRLNKNDLKEVIMRLVSQLVQPGVVGNIGGILDKMMYLYTDDAIDNALELASNNLMMYEELITRFNANLVTVEDQENEALKNKPGSLPYLAKISHSLSHSELWGDVEKELRSSFGSKKNPGYKS